MSTIRYNLRADKTDKVGKQPIELIYQVNGQRKYYSTRLKLFPQNWDSVQQLGIYISDKIIKKENPLATARDILSSNDIKRVNGKLSEFNNLISDIETKFGIDRETYSAAKVIEVLKSKIGDATIKDEASDLVYDYIDQYIERNKVTREPGSLSVYKSLKTHLQAFQKSASIKISFSTIDKGFFEKFNNFLVTPRKVLVESKKTGGEPKWKTVSLNNTTAAKQLSTLKTFLGYARGEGITVNDQYKNFKIKKQKLEVVALTNNEFEILFNLDLSGNTRLAQTRDIFCFSCATGLRYSDLAQLKREHIKNDEIRITVKKTRTDLTVPLNPYSAIILDRYKDKHYPLPVSGAMKLISNQKLNLYVKELCKLAGINEAIEIVRYRGTKREAIVYPKYELIGVHTGRKTFCSISLEKGMTAEEVMKISGHEDYQSFKRYVNITEQRKRESMQKAWGVISNSTPIKSHLKIVG